MTFADENGKTAFTMLSTIIIMNMEKMLGGEFDKGLTQMKTVAEAADRTK